VFPFDTPHTLRRLSCTQDERKKNQHFNDYVDADVLSKSRERNKSKAKAEQQQHPMGRRKTHPYFGFWMAVQSAPSEAELFQWESGKHVRIQELGLQCRVLRGQVSMLSPSYFAQQSLIVTLRLRCRYLSARRMGQDDVCVRRSHNRVQPLDAAGKCFQMLTDPNPGWPCFVHVRHKPSRPRLEAISTPLK
jgi:hypothetical protein